jgi:hypothetical protein
MTRAERRDHTRTAYHEAGHAIIAYVLGFTPYRATIAAGVNETGPYLGEVRIKVPEDVFLIPHSMAQYMIHELAGFTAQDRYSRRGVIKSCQDVDGAGDLQNFYKHWFELNAQASESCSDCDEFQYATLAIVRHYWSAIDAFAKMLLGRGTIEDGELERTLAKATESCERFPLFDYIDVGPFENEESLPFGRYADLSADSSQTARELGRFLS